MRNGKLSLPTSSTSTLASSQLFHSAPTHKLKAALPKMTENFSLNSFKISQTKNKSLTDLKNGNVACSGDPIAIPTRCSSCMDSLKDDKTFLKCLEEGGSTSYQLLETNNSLDGGYQVVNVRVGIFLTKCF